MNEIWGWIIAITIVTVGIKEAIKFFMHFSKKGIEGNKDNIPANNTPVDLSPVMDAVGACNTNILKVATDVGKTNGILEILQENFTEYKKTTDGKINLLEKRTAPLAAIDIHKEQGKKKLDTY